MKKFALLLLVLTLVTSASVPAFGNEKRVDYANEASALINETLDKIQDKNQKDKIKDILLTPIYSINVTDENTNSMEEPQVNVDEIVNLINDLAVLSNEDLDNIIRGRIDKIIEVIKLNPDAKLLGSGYNVLEKYISPFELSAIKEIKNPTLDRLSDATTMSTLVYDKTGTKKIYNLLIYIGSITLNVRWTVENGKIIDYFPTITGTSGSSCWITSSGIPSSYLGQRAYVNGKAVWLAGFTGTITSWFYNDGGFDIS